MSSQVCLNCRRCPQDILMLDCQHHFCLPCSATLAQLPYHFICPLCARRTILLPETARQLQSQLSPQASQGRIVSTPSSRMQSGMIMCKEHKEEQVMFFCFDCLTSCICAECAVRGKHKLHEVMQTKMARPIIESNFKGLNRSLQRRLEEWQDMRNSYQSELLLLRQTEKSVVQKLDVLFEEKKQCLKQHFEQIKMKAKTLLADSFQDVAVNLEEIDIKMGSILNFQKQVRSWPQLGDAEVLNRFVEGKAQVEAMIAERREMPRLGEWGDKLDRLVELARGIQID